MKRTFRSHFPRFLTIMFTTITLTAMAFMVHAEPLVDVKGAGAPVALGKKVTGQVGDALESGYDKILKTLGPEAVIMGKASLVKRCGKYLSTQQISLGGCLMTVTQQFTDLGISTKTVTVANVADMLSPCPRPSTGIAGLKTGLNDTKCKLQAAIKRYGIPTENPIIYTATVNLMNVGNASASGNQVVLSTRGGKTQVLQTKNIDSAFTAAAYVFTDEADDAGLVVAAFKDMIAKCAPPKSGNPVEAALKTMMPETPSPEDMAKRVVKKTEGVAEALGSGAGDVAGALVPKGFF